MENKVNIKVLTTSPDFKVLDVSGRSGDVLKKHQVNINGLLLVREGNIIYSEDTRLLLLAAGDSVDIPANVVHEITCKNEAKFFVVLPKKSQMRFEK